MRVWLTCFVLLFVAVELLQWFQHYILPLPFYGIGGLLLAIASNAGKSNTGKSTGFPRKIAGDQ